MATASTSNTTVGRFYCETLEGPRKMRAAVSGVSTALMAVAAYLIILRPFDIPSWIGLPLAMALIGSASLEIALGCSITLEAGGLRAKWRTRERSFRYPEMMVARRGEMLTVTSKDDGVLLVRAPWWRPNGAGDLARLLEQIQTRTKDEVVGNLGRR